MLELQVLVYPYPEMVLMDISPDTFSEEYQASEARAAFVTLPEPQMRAVESVLEALQSEFGCTDRITPLIRNSLFIQLR